MPPARAGQRTVTERVRLMRSAMTNPPGDARLYRVAGASVASDSLPDFRTPADLNQSSFFASAAMTIPIAT